MPGPVPYLSHTPIFFPKIARSTLLLRLLLLPLAALSGETVGSGTCVDPRTGAETQCAPAEATMASASWNGQVIASFSGEHPSVDGNVYFPADSLDMQYFKPSTHTSRCPYKGTASYFDVVVDGQVNKNAAWIYKTPKSGMEKIANHVAFWKGVVVTKV